jgi:peptide-O-fucosyltransferase
LNLFYYKGIHLRNDLDWERACDNVESYQTRSYMASPQCLDLPSSTHDFVTRKICYPSDDEILRLLKNIVLRTRIRNIYVATDKRPMIKEIEEHLSAQRVRVKHLDPWLPVIDVAMLAHANYFIGNCVSSFTSIVKRARDVNGLPSAFWSFSN